MVTRGAEGALLVDDEGVREISAPAVEEPVDICGAGDSFAAGMALVLGSGGGHGDGDSLWRFGLERHYHEKRNRRRRP